jgi:hypothetical protein
MKRALKISAVLVGLVALGIYFSFPNYKHRYRLTIEAEVDGAVRVSSSVIEVHWRLWPSALAGLFGGGVGDVRVYGQAIFIDLGQYGALLALVWPSNVTPPSDAIGADFLAIRAFNPGPDLRSSGYPLTWSLLRAMSWRTGTTTLTSQNLPGFIWLPNINEKDSARPLIAKEFSSVFNGTVQLRTAWVEITTDPVTTGLEDRLPWLRSLADQQRKSGITSYPGQFVLEAQTLLGDGF